MTLPVLIGSLTKKYLLCHCATITSLKLDSTIQLSGAPSVNIKYMWQTCHRCMCYLQQTTLLRYLGYTKEICLPNLHAAEEHWLVKTTRQGILVSQNYQKNCFRSTKFGDIRLLGAPEPVVHSCWNNWVVGVVVSRWWHCTTLHLLHSQVWIKREIKNKIK